MKLRFQFLFAIVLILMVIAFLPACDSSGKPTAATTAGEKIAVAAATGAATSAVGQYDQTGKVNSTQVAAAATQAALAELPAATTGAATASGS